MAKVIYASKAALLALPRIGSNRIYYGSLFLITMFLILIIRWYAATIIVAKIYSIMQAARIHHCLQR
jgi:hypothetical protein